LTQAQACPACGAYQLSSRFAFDFHRSLLGSCASSMCCLTVRRRRRETLKVKSRTRRLIFSRIEFGAPVAGHCSVCDRSFEIAFEDKMTLGEAHRRLGDMFNDHVCNDSVKQPGPQLVKESPD